ncbi:MAG: hypothetical protein KIT73_06135, partial [Burkholderiales bacterium]|nr:hypothetical protein [Burkholderiales bacterium]
MGGALDDFEGALLGAIAGAAVGFALRRNRLPADLEARIAALEAQVAQLQRTAGSGSSIEAVASTDATVPGEASSPLVNSADVPPSTPATAELTPAEQFFRDAGGVPADSPAPPPGEHPITATPAPAEEVPPREPITPVPPNF